MCLCTLSTGCCVSSGCVRKRRHCPWNSLGTGRICRSSQNAAKDSRDTTIKGWFLTKFLPFCFSHTNAIISVSFFDLQTLIFCGFGRIFQVWTLLTQFFLFRFWKISLICLEGKWITPRLGTTILFPSSQQLPRLRLGPLKGFLNWHSALQGPSTCLVHCFRSYIESSTPLVVTS